MQLFTSLYSLLPSSRTYLVKGGLSSSAAAYILIGCFLGGVVGIQLSSRLIHLFIPSHVIDCDHTRDNFHDEGTDGSSQRDQDSSYGSGCYNEDTPLLHRPLEVEGPGRPSDRSIADQVRYSAPKAPLQARLKHQITTLVSRHSTMCDGDDSCYGYTKPCAKERLPARPGCSSDAMTKQAISSSTPHPSTPQEPAENPDARLAYDVSNSFADADSEEESNKARQTGRSPEEIMQKDAQADPKSTSRVNTMQRGVSVDLERGHALPGEGNPAEGSGHHHHVPSNAFLSIGLQTSAAIALHKLPEGFITFATNHVNPSLGLAVFLALFIHNITEGFAMSLPLFLAFESRFKAIFWSSLLGGVSQPLGAGIAAIWLQTAGERELAPGERLYGAMFAVTAGIMTSVALQLFSESLELTRDSKGLCIAFAFVGMGILGLSFALTA